MSEEIHELDNIVKITDSTSPKDRDYLFSTALRMRPRIYDRHGCILWQVKGSCIAFAISHLIPLVWEWGLQVEGNKAVKKSMKVDKKGSGSYKLPEAYEIKLTKIPPTNNLGDPPQIDIEETEEAEDD